MNISDDLKQIQGKIDEIAILILVGTSNDMDEIIELLDSIQNELKTPNE